MFSMQYTGAAQHTTSIATSSPARSPAPPRGGIIEPSISSHLNVSDRKQNDAYLHGLAVGEVCFSC